LITRIFCPNPFSASSLMMRTVVSTAPPAAKGTMMLIGLEGKGA